MERDDPTIAWLPEGDPVIRRQTMRDVLDEPAGILEAELLVKMEPGGESRWNTLRALRTLRAAGA